MQSHEDKKIWNKPEYPFNPHVTVYDGDSATFASELYDVLSRHTYLLGFQADKLTALITKSGTKSHYRPVQFDVDEISKIVGESINCSQVSEMSMHRRLTLIDRLCGFLEHTSLKTNPNFVFAENTKRKARKTMLESLRHGILSWT